MSRVRRLIQGRELDERADLLLGGVQEADLVTTAVFVLLACWFLLWLWRWISE